MTTTYPIGTVATATIRGKSCRAMKAKNGWTVDRPISNSHWWADVDVTDIRPLVVLDLTTEQRGVAVYMLREVADEYCTEDASILARFIAAQIEKQTKPPRIPEPGFDGAVQASDKCDIDRVRWVRAWADEDTVRPWTNGGRHAAWDELIDPVLIREGLS